MEIPTKEYGIYHWDTFDEPGNDTVLVGEADDWVEAMSFVYQNYGDRIDFHGADQVQIVQFHNGQGTIIERFQIR
jgi:hypothetical protein